MPEKWLMASCFRAFDSIQKVPCFYFFSTFGIEMSLWTRAQCTDQSTTSYYAALVKLVAETKYIDERAWKLIWPKIVYSIVRKIVSLRHSSIVCEFGRLRITFNWQRAFSYATHSTFLPIKQPIWCEWADRIPVNANITFKFYPSNGKRATQFSIHCVMPLNEAIRVAIYFRVCSSPAYSATVYSCRLLSCMSFQLSTLLSVCICACIALFGMLSIEKEELWLLCCAVLLCSLQRIRRIWFSSYSSDENLFLLLWCAYYIQMVLWEIPQGEDRRRSVIRLTHTRTHIRSHVLCMHACVCCYCALDQAYCYALCQRTRQTRIHSHTHMQHNYAHCARRTIWVRACSFVFIGFFFYFVCLVV